MQRFYHSTRRWIGTVSRQRLIIAISVLAIVLLYFAPLFKYLPEALDLGKQYLMSSGQLRGDKHVNILVLGLGGPKNEPSGLTDTVLFTSIDRSSGKTLLLSLPRDIWVPEMRAKINTAYYYGNQKEGLGMEWARRYVSEIVGQPIDYVVVISFDGFVKIVDYLGGIDVDVDKAFVDTEYPMPGRENDPCQGDPKTRCRYETISFSQDLQHMDGTTALKFARSRHSDDGEGSDFARAARQQKIIVAIREKVLQLSFFLSPTHVAGLLDLIVNSIETDIPQSHFASFGKLALRARDSNIGSQIIPGSIEENKKEGFLYHPRPSRLQDNQWVLVPRADTWQPLQEWVECLLVNDQCPVEEYTKSIKD